MSLTDNLYARPTADIAHFQFDDAVAHVFDDMLERSIPGYPLLQDLILSLASHWIHPGSHIYDLGCSTGTTAQLLRPIIDQQNAHLTLMDNSPAMLQKTREKLALTPQITTSKT